MKTETREVPAGHHRRPSLRGVGLVIRIEAARARSGRAGRIGAIVGVALTAGLAVLGWVLLGTPDHPDSTLLEALLALLLAIGLISAPSATATAINGDSSAGVLAPLQMTRLTASDLALGKLVSAMSLPVAAMVIASPLLAWGWLRSSWSLGQVVLALLVVLAMVLAAAAVGLAWSSATARGAISIMLTHLTNGLFIAGTAIGYLVLAMLFSTSATDIYHDRDWENVTDAELAEHADDPYWMPETCVTTEVTFTQPGFDTFWWMWIPNPFLGLIEVAPTYDEAAQAYEEPNWGWRVNQSPMQRVHGAFAGVRSDDGLLSTPEGGEYFFAGCRADGTVDPDFDAATDPMYGGFDPDESAEPADVDADGPQWDDWTQEEIDAMEQPSLWWPTLVFQAVVLVASLALAVHRLSVPFTKLSKGTRVA